MIRKTIARALRFFTKDRPRVKDSVRVFGGAADPGWRGMRMPDGSPVSVEKIMATFCVSRGMAEEIAKRSTR